MRYVVDSRTVSAGDCFVALEGEHTDGHLYLDEAYRKGATSALVRPGFQTELPIMLLEVEDRVAFLQELTKKRIQEVKPLIIGITGSHGKTTTKHLLFQLLYPYYRVMASPGNQNTELGLPLAILNELNEGTTHAILEMGMRDLHQIEKLVEIAPPDLAILLEIGSAHIGVLGSQDRIAKAKAEIFSHPQTKRGLLHHSFFTYGIELPLHLTYDSYGFFSEKKGPPTWPDYMHSNLEAAIWAAKEVGLTDLQIEATLPHLSLFQHRWERKKWQDIELIDDCYNANPHSMLAAFGEIEKMDHPGQKIAILGSMGDLGALSKKEHQRVLTEALNLFDRVLLLGEWPILEGAFYLPSKEAAWEYYMTHLHQSGDLVFVKGSKFHYLWEVLPTCCSG